MVPYLILCFQFFSIKDSDNIPLVSCGFHRKCSRYIFSKIQNTAIFQFFYEYWPDIFHLKVGCGLEYQFMIVIFTHYRCIPVQIIKSQIFPANYLFIIIDQFIKLGFISNGTAPSILQCFPAFPVIIRYHSSIFQDLC